MLPVRDVPTNNEQLGPVAKAAEPAIKQIFVADLKTTEPLDPKLYVLRKRAEKKIAALNVAGKEDFYIVS